MKDNYDEKAVGETTETVNKETTDTNESVSTEVNVPVESVSPENSESSESGEPESGEPSMTETPEPEKPEVTIGDTDTSTGETPKEKKKTNKGESDNKAKIIGAIIGLAIFIVMIIALGMSKSAGKQVIKAVDELQAKNPYIQMMVGQDKYIYLLYNKKGEAFAESNTGGSAFYRNDGKILALSSDEIIVDTDLNPLMFIKAAAQVAMDNEDSGCSVKVRESTYTEDTTGKEEVNRLYTITVAGKENISKIYATLNDEEYVAKSIEMLYSGFEDVEKSQIDVTVSVGESGRFGAVCNVAYGDALEANGNSDNVFTSWVFDGYIPTFDWEYPKEIYDDVTSRTVEEWNNVAADVTTYLSEKMYNFMEENNMMVSNAETESITKEQFMAMTDEEQMTQINVLQGDLYNYGFEFYCSKEDVLKDIKDYYSQDDSSSDVSLFQAGINVGVGKGWLYSIETDGKQVETNEAQSTEIVDNTEVETGTGTGTGESAATNESVE